jgi:hypothetical protein
MDGVDMNPGYDASRAYPVRAGKDLYARVDGVKTSIMQRNDVYKIPTDGRVRIDGQGKPNCSSPLMLLPDFGNVRAPDSAWYRLRDAFKFARFLRL